VGIREKLNENPAITTGATIGIIVIALIFIGYQIFSSGQSYNIPTSAFFTTDDSSPDAALANLFEDDIQKLPPFDHNGKQAYRAYVFSCDGGKNKWVGYLERYSKEAQKAITDARASNKPETQPMMDMAMMSGVEVKRPGDKVWIKRSEPGKLGAIMNIKCPDGTVEKIESVMP
jgi:hypothetical protein